MINEGWQQGYYLVGSEVIQVYVAGPDNDPEFEHLPVNWPDNGWRLTESQPVEFMQDHQGRVIHIKPALDKSFIDTWPKPEQPEGEYTGGSSSYYTVEVKNPTTPGNPPYIAECNDIIEALQMDFGDANIFKAIWRIAASKQGKQKQGHNERYDREKIRFFNDRYFANDNTASDH
jgi:hypothetical protein